MIATLRPRQHRDREKFFRAEKGANQQHLSFGPCREARPFIADGGHLPNVLRRFERLVVSPERTTGFGCRLFVRINGETRYLWWAVDHEGEILESYVSKTREKKAALAFMKKALKRHGSPETITTDGLRSYSAATRELGNADRRDVGRHANNRVENSHLPFRRRERAMLRFRRIKSLQRFASVHANIHNHFASERHLIDRQTYKQRRSAALAEWQTFAS